MGMNLKCVGIANFNGYIMFFLLVEILAIPVKVKMVQLSGDDVSRLAEEIERHKPNVLGAYIPKLMELVN